MTTFFLPIPRLPTGFANWGFAVIDEPRWVSDGYGRKRGLQIRLQLAASMSVYRSVAKNARTSSTNNSGCSNAAKCPPRGILVKRVML
jgi:hypothetical protein